MNLEHLTIESSAAEAERAAKNAYLAASKVIGNHHDAEDAAQEAVERSLRKITSVEKGKLHSYAYVAGKNIAYEIQRQRIRRPTDSLETLQEKGFDLVNRDMSTNPQNVVERQYEAERIREAIEALPRIHREVVNLRYWGGLGPDEIAKELGIRPGTVRTRLFRAHHRLGKELSELA